MPTWPTGVDVNPQLDPQTADQLSAAVANRVEQLSAWRPFVTRVMFKAQIKAHAVAPMFTTLAGPDGQVEAYSLPADGSAPSIPDPANWATGDNVTPREIVAITTTTSEFDADARLIGPITAGVPEPEREKDRIDPLLAAHLAEALVRKDSTLFARGAGSNDEPIRGLVHNPNIISRPAGGPISYNALLEQYWALVDDGRFPNAAFVSPTAAKRLRQETDGSGDVIFPPGKPMLLDVRREADGSETAVPVVPLYGMPSGGPSGTPCALIGDFRHVVTLHRVMPNGKLVGLASSWIGPDSFSKDRRTWRVAERFDIGVAPGSGDNIVKLTFDA
jgi:hypothetical protein